MTSGERMNLTLKHIEPDRTPIFEYVLLSPVADNILGKKYVDFAGQPRLWVTLMKETSWEKALKQYANDRLELADKLGHDMLYVIPNPLPTDREAKLQGEIIDHFNEDDPVERIKIRNCYIQEELQRPLNDNIFFIYELLKDKMKEKDMDQYLFAPAYFHGIWTDVDLMETMILSPEIAQRHFELATEKALLFINKYIELGIKLIGIGGDFAGNRLLISPKSYKNFIVPEVVKLANAIHKAGSYAINASDGDLWPVIDDFLCGCEVDGYMEIDMKAGMDLGKLKKSYGEKITFFGNMDCGEVLSFSSLEDIRNITFRCLENGSGKGGHVFSASNAITASVHIENYMEMVNAYKDYFGLAKIKI